MPKKDNRGRTSALDLQVDCWNALTQSKYTAEFAGTQFDFARPDLQSPDGTFFVSMASSLDASRIQDLLEIAGVKEVEQRFVFLATEQLTDPSMKRRGDGKMLNLLSQSLQRMIGNLRPERVIAIYKRKAYAPAPYPVQDRSLLEPRMIWSEITDAISMQVFNDYLKHSAFSQVAETAQAAPVQAETVAAE